MSRHVLDLAGQTFGRLTVLQMERRDGETWAICRCACGAAKETRAQALGRGVNSCGCLRADYRRSQWLKHGESNHGGADTPEYRAWARMIRRCIDPAKAHVYRDRGISVCAAWRSSFVAFLQDVGRRPSPEYSIDRIDNGGNYEPGNVRWATRSEQALNRRERPRVRGAFAPGRL